MRSAFLLFRSAVERKLWSNPVHMGHYVQSVNIFTHYCRLSFMLSVTNIKQWEPMGFIYEIHIHIWAPLSESHSNMVGFEIVLLDYFNTNVTFPSDYILKLITVCYNVSFNL